jgi:hypothetical protein
MLHILETGAARLKARCAGERQIAESNPQLHLQPVSYEPEPGPQSCPQFELDASVNFA